MEPDLPRQMMQLITGDWVSQTVSTAARLGVADVLARGPHRIDVIAEDVGADADALYRLLRALAGLGVVEELDDREFMPTELGELLRTDAPNSLRGFAVMVGSPWHRRAWTDLAESVRTGESAFTRLFGDSWAYFRDHPDDGEVDDRSETRILSNCRAAMNHRGRVLLCEAVIPDKAGEPSSAALIDLEMLVMAPGARQRTAGEFERLFQDAGLRLSGIAAVGDTYSVVEAEAG